MTGVFLVKSQKTCQDRVQLHEISTCLGHAGKEAQNMKGDQANVAVQDESNQPLDHSHPSPGLQPVTVNHHAEQEMSLCVL